MNINFQQSYQLVSYGKHLQSVRGGHLNKRRKGQRSCYLTKIIQKKKVHSKCKNTGKSPGGSPAGKAFNSTQEQRGGLMKASVLRKWKIKRNLERRKLVRWHNTPPCFHKLNKKWNVATLRLFLNKEYYRANFGRQNTVFIYLSIYSLYLTLSIQSYHKKKRENENQGI